MNKKKFILFPLLALFLSSCLFDTDDDGLSNWLSDQGMPSSYDVQTVTVPDLKPVSAKVFENLRPKSIYSSGIFGATSGMSHDVVFDFVIDTTVYTSFWTGLKKADSAKSFLQLRLVDSYYLFKPAPSGILPVEDDIELNVSWILSDKLTGQEINDLASINDSAWQYGLTTWKAKKSADTTASISIKAVTSSKTVSLADTLLELNLPSALVNDIRKKTCSRRLQLRLSAPEAPHVYRFYGPDVFSPRLVVQNSETGDFLRFNTVRAAVIPKNQEKCKDCLVLHGGSLDSLEVEFPSKPIMKALSEFYGDEFPYNVGDSNDVRQAVVMAELTFYRDDTKGESEIDLPIMVRNGSYVDSAESVVFRAENYIPDRLRINEHGHPNMVFYEGDSLALQVTAGMRNFINKASDGRSFRMLMRLERSVLLPSDSSYSVLVRQDTTFKDEDKKEVKSIRTDTIPVFFPYTNYARYDFSTIKNKPATLKLWLASKRGENTDKKKIVKIDTAKSVKTEGKKVTTSTARGGK